MLGFFYGGAPSSGELVLVFLAILLLFGAKRLPGIARNMGKALEEFRRAARDVTDEIMRADTDKPEPPSRALPRGNHGEGQTEEDVPGGPEEEPIPIDDEIEEDDEQQRDTPA